MINKLMIGLYLFRDNGYVTIPEHVSDQEGV